MELLLVMFALVPFIAVLALLLGISLAQHPEPVDYVRLEALRAEQRLRAVGSETVRRMTEHLPHRPPPPPY